MQQLKSEVLTFKYQAAQPKERISKVMCHTVHSICNTPQTRCNTSNNICRTANGACRTVHDAAESVNHLQPVKSYQRQTNHTHPVNIYRYPRASL